MTVEAQVCPQCGAAILFAEGQTEAVCAYCGTPVVRAAVLSAVEKERADEQLVQETVGLEKRLAAHGRPATGKIVAARTTDIFRQTVEGRAVLMAFTLEVQPDAETAFTAETRALIRLTAVDKYRAGVLLDVRCDPHDHAQVAVVGRHGAGDGSQLGVADWQQRIVDWAAAQFRQEHGIDLRQDALALQRLQRAAELAQRELAAAAETELNLPFITADADGPKHLNLRLSRAKFEQITGSQPDQ